MRSQKLKLTHTKPREFYLYSNFIKRFWIMKLRMIRNHHLRLLVLCCCIALLLAEDERNFSHGDECSRKFHCENLGLFYFPFTNTSNRNCGLHIKGRDGKEAKAVLETKNSTSYKVKCITADNKISVHDDVLQSFLNSRNCSVFNYSLGLPEKSPMMSFKIVMEENMTVYKCKHTIKGSFHGNFTCRDYHIYYNLGSDRIKDKSSGVSNPCSRIQLPIRFPHPKPKLTPNSPDPFSLLTSDFQIQVNLSKECYDCYHEKGGQCRLEQSNHFYCAVERSWIWKPLLGLAVIILLLLTILLIYMRRCILSRRKVQTRNTCADPYTILNPTTCNVFFGVPVFTYKELEEATNNFHHTRELGDGAFGTVYYGKLKDGREVAIKRLSKNNYRRVEQFMTEIKILTRLRHRNLVTFYGFSSLRTLRSHELLIVYEYISNGTVSYHLYGDMAKAYLLPWPTRMKIAIETASALAYLHASDIIHRDVKTSNILLDSNFCVKVADFGLSRLFPNNATHVCTGPQGTPGYVDPEYQQNCQLSSKSDVYSFGVVLVELISSMRAIDVTRDRDEVNLANLALKKIQKNALSELVDPSLNFESDIEVKRMILSVAELAFRCLQWDKELRPSMDEVLKNLKRIENGKNETEQLEEANVHGAVISRGNLIPMPATSLDWDEIELLKNMKLPLSPNDIADKWESESTTTSVSVHSLA